MDGRGGKIQKKETKKRSKDLLTNEFTVFFNCLNAKNAYVVFKLVLLTVSIASAGLEFDLTHSCLQLII
ncbi:hypothetical protein [Candidatus Magnetominusculus dajiuhuensis]|uniref:hypothetical protein n=1 Tax=Candidatus Magnetominusculus dajiuhuensis TaxID=3137712 RepID=UPI003B42CA7E